MNEATISRARLVELLWQLKQQLDQSGGAGEIRFVHFNTLLNDPQYRDEVIRHAAHSSVKKVRALGQQLITVDQKNAALLSSSHQYAQPGNRAESAPQMQTQTQRRGGSSKRVPVISLIALALLLGSYAGWRYYQDIRQAVSGIQVVSGSIEGNERWRAGRTVRLDGLTFVESGAKLTIEPGVTVLGAPGSALVVTRGARIFARGTASEPVVFTSAQPEGHRVSGDWGGVVLLGAAPVNAGNAHIEGIESGDSRGDFGGNDISYSCGVMEYVRIEFAGQEISKDNELNGLTLGGCGSDTITRYIQVHRGKDDGIELFGGSANLQYIVITGAADDSLDWDMGWRGQVQFLVAQQHKDTGDNAFEGDSNKADHDAEPRSEPVIYNATLVSPRSRGKLQRAMTIRRGSAGQFYNFLVSGFSGELIDISDASSAQLASQGDIRFEGLITHATASFDDESGDSDDDAGFDEAQWLASNNSGLLLDRDPALPRSARDSINPSFVPARSSPAMSGGRRPPKGEFWDESATYLGAVRPGSISTWLDGWTHFPAH